MLLRFVVQNERTACLGVCSLGELPDAAGGLIQLQTLSMASCGLRQLPPTIGRLQHLITLDISQNGIRELPASLGELPGFCMVSDIAWLPS